MSKSQSIVNGPTWEIARRPTGAEFEDGNLRDIVLCVDRATGNIRAVNLIDHSDLRTSAVWQTMQKAIKDPMPGNSPQRPGQVIVDDRKLAALLQNQMGDVRVSHQARLPMLDMAYEMLMASLQRGPGYSYLSTGRISVARVEALAKETVRYLSSAPFEEVNSDSLIRLEGPWQSPLYAAVLGNAGTEYGLALYFTREGFLAMLGGEDPESLAQHPILSLTLVGEEDCPELLDAEIRQHRWPVHPLGFPVLLRTDNEDVEPMPEDVELMILCLEAVRRFVKKGRAGTFCVQGQDIRVDWEPTNPTGWRQVLGGFMAELAAESPSPAGRRKKARSKR